MSSHTLSVSVVIPNYNGKHLLEKHLPAVIQAVGKSQIIVVDDASNDESVAFLNEKYPKVEIVKHKTNKRFAAACNSGFVKATGDVVVLLNNDVSPTKGFLKPLLKHFEDERVFAVGCAEKEAETSDFVSGRGCGTYARGFLTHWRCDEQKKSLSLWASGGSGAYRKSIWNKLGGMDVLFAPAYEEDRDISYRAFKRGYRVWFEPESVVIHKHETTNKKELGNQDMLISSYKNQFLIVWKNVGDRRMLTNHALWLPYHIIVGGVRTRGLLVKGLMRALGQFGEMRKRRVVEQKQVRVSDKEVLAML